MFYRGMLAMWEMPHGYTLWLYVLRMFYRGMAMREMPCCRQHLCCFCLSEFVRSKLTKQLGGEADAAGGSPSLEEVVPPCGPVLLRQGMVRPLLIAYLLLTTHYVLGGPRATA